MSELFGNYQLLERIGGGGLGEVHRAQRSDQEKCVALKRLNRAHLESAAHRALFQIETERSLVFQGTHLVSAFQSGEFERWPFLLMRLADGALRDRLGAPLPPTTVATLSQDLCLALDSLHRHGFVHCDLSPSNVLLDDDRAGLCDFGTSTPIGSQQAQPQGSYPYMSPEQVRRLPLDVRSDVFSAASLLWECATGVKLFHRNAQHLTLAAVVEDEVPAILDTLAPAAQGKLSRYQQEFLLATERALRPALHKEQSARYPTISEFGQALREALII